ncbi:MAG: TonB-dependent receptor [Cyclobacteriaceae bacterium]
MKQRLRETTKRKYCLKVATLMLVLSCFVLQPILASEYKEGAEQDDLTVTGTVKDGSTGESLPGVTVIIKGSTIGTVTDIDGSYSINIEDPEGAILSFSFVGFRSQEVQVGNQNIIDVQLQVDVQSLEEVVVVGYGTQRKSDLTGAVASISGDELRTAITSSVDQALQGRVAGVQVSQNSGQPGGAVSIRIRGTTSLTQSSEPLYVIDGVQIGGEASSSVGFTWAGGSNGQSSNINPLAFLNPNDIETIDVLKDASATAIYGSRAANGVVIITTKRGKAGEGKISYDGFYAVQDVYKTFDMMNLREYAAYSNEVAQEVSSIDPNPRFADPSLLGTGTDWQEAVFRVAPMQSHTVTFSGGTDANRYMLSAGYLSQEGIVIGSNFERFSLRLNVDSKINDRITVGTSMTLSRKDEKIVLQDGGDGVIAQAAQAPPHIPVRNFDGSFAGPTQQNASAQVGSNPVALALLRNNTALDTRFVNNIFGEIKILEGLKFRSEFATDISTLSSSAFVPTYEWGMIVNNTSQLAQLSNQNLFWLWKNFATYDKVVGKHKFTGLLGTESQKSQYEGLTAYKVNLPNDIQVINQGDISNIPNTGFKGWSSLASYFLRANYSFADRYFLTATVRRDGSSRFGPNNRWGWFPSVSVAWRVINEPFIPESNVVSDLKVRLGWGQVGNERIDNYAFGSSLVSLNSYFGSAVRNNAYSNRDVQWESTTMLNAGIDLELFSGRVSLEANAYEKKTDNLLLRVNLPATFGGEVQGPQANVGSMKNTGIELAVNTKNIDGNKFKWSSNANISVNRNKVTDIGGIQFFENLYWYSGFQTASTTVANKPVGQFYGYVMEGIFTSAEEIANHAVQIPSTQDPAVNKIDRTTGVWLGDIKWKDLDGNGIINTDDQKIIGDPNPDFTFGLNNQFEYGNLVLDVYVIGSVGGDILNYSRARNEQMLSNFDNQSRTVINRAKTQLVEGGTDFNNINDVELVDPSVQIPRFDNGAENFNHFMSTRWIEDGTYARIQNVKLSYRLPAAWTQKVRISNMLVYLNVQNVVTFTNYSGLDPQIGSFDQSARQLNVDMGRYPVPRVYTVGVKLDF